jgi:AcrR family transcriptional regulator
MVRHGVPAESRRISEVILMTPTYKATLGREEWFRAGLEALAESGPAVLKAATLARTLDVTTGSFYWHFSSIAEFRSELLVYWKEEVIVGLIRGAKERAQHPTQVLAELRKGIVSSGAHRYDAAIRCWALDEPWVRKTVNAADELRGAFLVETLCERGMTEEDARDRANLIGAAWRGSLDLKDPDYRMRLIRLAASD